MAEVQQTSDATFRLFDWNRRDANGQMRQLHIEQALACIDWSSGPVNPLRARDYPQPEARSARQRTSTAVRQRLVHCPYFALEYLHYSEPFTCGTDGVLQVLLVLHGRGRLWTSEGVWQLTPGDAFVLPAALGALTFHPEGNLGLLVSTLP